MCPCGKTVQIQQLIDHQKSWCNFAGELEDLKAKATETAEIARQFLRDPAKLQQISAVFRDLYKPFMVLIFDQIQSNNT
jgi:hypothetical protein